MALGAAEHGDRADDRAAEAQLARRLRRAGAEREGLEVHAGRDRDDALGRHAGLDDEPPDGLAARDHAVGEPAVDRIQAPPDGDRDVPGPHHRHAAEPGRHAAEPGVDRAVRVHEAHPLAPDQPHQARPARADPPDRACGPARSRGRPRAPAPAGARRAGPPRARASRARPSSAPRRACASPGRRGPARTRCAAPSSRDGLPDLVQHLVRLDPGEADMVDGTAREKARRARSCAVEGPASRPRGAVRRRSVGPKSVTVATSDRGGQVRDAGVAAHEAAQAREQARQQRGPVAADQRRDRSAGRAGRPRRRWPRRPALPSKHGREPGARRAVARGARRPPGARASSCRRPRRGGGRPGARRPRPRPRPGAARSRRPSPHRAAASTRARRATPLTPSGASSAAYSSTWCRRGAGSGSASVRSAARPSVA